MSLQTGVEANRMLSRICFKCCTITVWHNASVYTTLHASRFLTHSLQLFRKPAIYPRGMWLPRSRQNHAHVPSVFSLIYNLTYQVLLYVLSKPEQKVHLVSLQPLILYYSSLWPAGVVVWRQVVSVYSRVATYYSVMWMRIGIWWSLAVYLGLA